MHMYIILLICNLSCVNELSMFVFRDIVVTKAVVVVLADTLGLNVSSFFQSSTFYKNFLEECQNSDNPSLKETSDWALATINRITSG